MTIQSVTNAKAWDTKTRFATLIGSLALAAWTLVGPLGCSSDNDGTSSCESRCEGIASDCGGEASGCAEACNGGQLTDAVLTCLENAECDSVVGSQCMAQGQGGSGGSGGSSAGGSGGSSAGGSGGSSAGGSGGTTAGGCQSAEDCPYWYCDCEDGMVVNSRTCSNGSCLGAASVCPDSCESFGHGSWTGSAGGG
jgi:hypothetical protein